MRNVYRILSILLAAAAVAAALYQSLWLMPDPLAKARPEFQPSVQIMDREGRLLREFLSDKDTRNQWTRLADLSPHLIDAALAAEDKRFYRHHGVDIRAVFRAFWQNVTAGRIRSGASTITMQVARRIDPGPRTLSQKIRESIMALRIERSHDKSIILEEYLNRIPCGNLTYGVNAACRFYLNKNPDNLSPAEAAFIMALPQAPSLLNPLKNTGPALERRNYILDRMQALGFLTSAQAGRAKAEPLNLEPARNRFLAPHFITQVKQHLHRNHSGKVKTTLDAALNEQIQQLTAQEVANASDKGIGQAAVLVMDHQTREILVWVGSTDFFDPKDGQNDGVLALRQPGSAVKPFTYAAALDRDYTPATLIDDNKVDFRLRQGVYTPTNYDGRFHGEVSVRCALASSLNVPAVKVLSHVGVPVVHDKMKAAGLESLDKDPDYYGLALTLGAGEVTLLELANAYATLAAGGEYKAPVLMKGTTTAEPGQQVFSPQTAYLITHILSDDTARATGFGRDSLLALPFPAAAKTGTSKNFKDNYCVGYTSRLVVAVWAGNFDAKPMGRVSGISGAGPLWRKVMRLCAEQYTPEPFTRPHGLEEVKICAETGLRAVVGCPNQRTEIFKESNLPPGYCLLHHDPKARIARQVKSAPPDRLVITSPQNGERYLFDPGIETGFQNLRLSALAPAEVDRLAWYINGEIIARVDAARQEPALFWPLERGRLRIRVVAEREGATLYSDEVTVQVY
jgi:penicillin-binding protein 1C